MMIEPRGRTALVLTGVAALAFALGVYWVLRLPPPEGSAPPEPTGLADRVRLDSPAPGATVGSPLSVVGVAPGPWYFEAVFPVRLVDARGRTVADTFAQAEGEWMTEELVPFRAAVRFAPPGTETGTLVLERSNPSGLPEHAAEVRIPVRFRSGVALRVFFPNSARDPDQLDCRRVFPVERRAAEVAPGDAVPGAEEERTAALARAALEALLRGPTPEERSEGYLTALPERAALRGVTVEEGVVRADFDAGLEEGVGGSCRVLAVRSQIEETLRGLPGVREAIVSVEGRTESALQP